MKNQRFFVKAEHVSLGGSVLGTILASVTGQAAWVADSSNTCFVIELAK